MTQPPELSILIVNWNGKEILRNLLASIERTQGDLLVQTIVVDNASADGSADLVAAEFPWVILHRNAQNLGFARGNNQAARSAAAPLLLLLNNDTVVRTGALQKLAQFMNEKPDVVAAGPRLIGADGKPQRSGRNLPTVAALLNSIQFLKWTCLFRRAYRQYRSEGFDPEKEGTVSQLAAAALVIRRDCLERIGGFDEGFAFGVEDVDLCRRMRGLGRIYYLPTAEIEHLGRVSSRANRGFVYRNYECGWARYLSKHHGHRAALLYKTLVTLDMPIRVTLLAIQFAMQSQLARSEKAARTLGRLKAAAHFTATGLPSFWRS
ncbi:MAG: glycosyltransferase family 2 protein [Tepidisphaeraceae bacterium]|jgi:GT2 family glycosyltransferase